LRARGWPPCAKRSRSRLPTQPTSPRRFLAAGNLTPLQFERERAAAAEQRIEATRAAAAAKRLRGELAALIGLPVQANWSTSDELPPFTTAQWQVDELVGLALEQRLDLAAARRSVSLREDALGITNRWRWLGAVEFGYEHESDIDGSVIRGPSLSIELPIFNQGQGALTAAQAELLASRARLDALTMQVEREASLGMDALDAARAIAEQYRSELVPSREAIVARTQEQVNFHAARRVRPAVREARRVRRLPGLHRGDARLLGRAHASATNGRWTPARRR
jgi:cobalt-zinc-cadmium efflux system outer membrane protein